MPTSGKKPAAESRNITQLLVAWSDGDPHALEELAPIVEAELRRLAKHYLRQERAGHALQTTELINEAFIRLIEWKNVKWQNRAHFMGMSAQMMRRILVDHARRQLSSKRGGEEAIRVSIEDVQSEVSSRGVDLLEIDQALTRLAALDQRKSRIVELRFFGGLNVEETAEVLEISSRTVKREWNLAQAWLYAELSGGEREA